jgi:lipopolysaccharide transport system permease protein
MRRMIEEARMENAELETRGNNIEIPPSAPYDGAASQHQVIIEPTSGWAAIHLGELWEFRDLLFFMVWRDLKSRYRQTALGPVWFILQPLMSMVLYSVIFGWIAKLPSDNQPYAVFTYVALLPWDFFTDSLNSGSNSLLGSMSLISKVYFPRLIVPLSQVISSLVDFALSLVVLAGMMIYYQIHPTWGIALIPFYLLLAALTGLGIGLWFSGIIVRYRDFGQIVGFLVRVLMYSAPVVYSISLVPEKWRTLYSLNPVTAVVEGFRWALLGTGIQPDWKLAVTTVCVVLLFIGGLYNFKRVERNIVDIA